MRLLKFTKGQSITLLGKYFTKYFLLCFSKKFSKQIKQKFQETCEHPS